MGRGVSSGGGQSSLGYLFGSGEPPKPVPAASKPPPQVQHAASSRSATGGGPSKPDENGVSHSVAAGVSLARNVNNYHRADGQNTGNFLTDRPSTKVHAAPGGGSSLGYLFGGGN